MKSGQAGAPAWPPVPLAAEVPPLLESPPLPAEPLMLPAMPDEPLAVPAGLSSPRSDAQAAMREPSAAKETTILALERVPLAPGMPPLPPVLGSGAGAPPSFTAEHRRARSPVGARRSEGRRESIAFLWVMVAFLTGQSARTVPRPGVPLSCAEQARRYGFPAAPPATDREQV